ncbi:GRAS [Ancistrocladus abbreviatus]
MSSGFSGGVGGGGGGGSDFYGGAGRLMTSTIGSNNNSGLINGNQGGGGYNRLQQQQLAEILAGVDPSSQIGHRRLDLIGKRSLADFQSYPQINLLHHNQQQQQSHQFSLLQQQLFQNQQQQTPLSLLQQHYLRSVKQRTTNSYPNYSLSLPSLDISSSSSPSPDILSPDAISPSLPRYGVPVYHQLRPNPISLIHNNNSSNWSTNGLLASNSLNPTHNQSIGYSNLGPNRVSDAISVEEQPKPAPESEKNSNNLNSGKKFINTLQELEKQLLEDNDEEEEGDAVSVITNSEWSETFQNLMSPGVHQTAITAATTPTATINSSATNNITTNMISPSPTSSSSSCSSSASPPPSSAKQLISEAATAISEGKTEAALEILSRLSQVGNVKGNSEQRLAVYMVHALKSRACPNDLAPPVMELYGREHSAATHTLYDLSHCFKYGMLAANLVMLEAIASEEKGRVHILDFDIGQGQYLHLIRALSERQAQSPTLSVELKITAVVSTEFTARNGGNNGVELKAVEDALLKLAERVGVGLRFNVVTRAIHELTRESLGVEEDEALLVNFAYRLFRVPDESVSMENYRDELLRRVKGLRPRVVTLVEQEMNGNTAPFLTRVNEACAYYGALFDSLDSTLPKDQLDRARVEEALGRKMANAVACEGRERVERCEMFGKWRARMGMAGFELKTQLLSQNVAESMRGRLNAARGGNPGFTVKEECGGVGIGWMGRTLTVTSAWR